MHEITRKFGKKDIKFYDTVYEGTLALASTSMDMNPSTIDCISAPAQGDTINNRNGHVIYMKSIEVSGFFHADKDESHTDTLNEPIATVWIVLDRQTNGAKKTGQSVLSVYSNVQATQAFPNLYYEDEFEILAKKEVVLRQPSINEGSVNLFAFNGLTIPFHLRYDFHPLQRVIFNSDSSEGIASVVDNSIQVFGCISEVHGNPTGYPTVQFNCRLLFYG